MKEIKSIIARADGGRDVIFDEDGKRLACQVYNKKDEPQIFTWPEVEAEVAEKLDADPGPLPDDRTKEEKTADRVAEIKAQLQALDALISRVEEDLADAMLFKVHALKNEARLKKADLRAEYATLTKVIT